MGASQSAEAEAGAALHQLAQALPNTADNGTAASSSAPVSASVSAPASSAVPPISTSQPSSPAGSASPPRQLVDVFTQTPSKSALSHSYPSDPTPPLAVVLPRPAQPLIPPPTDFFPLSARAKASADPFVAFLSALLDWVSPFTSGLGLTLAVHAPTLREVMLALPESQLFQQTLRQRQIEKRRRKRDLAAGNEKSSAESSEDPVFTAASLGLTGPTGLSIAIPYDVAALALAMDKKLAAVRLAAVPARVGESTFWFEYFGECGRALVQHITNIQPHCKTLTNNVNAAQ